MIEADSADVVDIALDANPASPWCWSVMTLERPREGAAEALISRRGTLSLLPVVWPAASCASARVLSATRGLVLTVADRVVWHQRWSIDFERLRSLNAHDCRVRAWLQFARFPFVAADRVADLRYENPFRANFSAMSLQSSAGCPSNVTNWDPPRRDMLVRRADR